MEVVDTEIHVAEGTLFARRWIAADDPRTPIVLLHDSLGCVELWREFPAALAEATKRTIIAYDRLGYGRSTRIDELPHRDFIRAEAERHFPQVMRELRVDDFIVFGHSVGGGMALLIAGLHSTKCKAVITEAAQAFVEERTLQGIRSAKETFADPKQFAKLGQLHGDKARWVLDAWAETWLAPQFRQWSLVEQLKNVTCPALVIHGDNDEYGSQAFPETIAAEVSGPTQMEILRGCGHIPHREHPNTFLRLVNEFLRHYCV